MYTRRCHEKTPKSVCKNYSLSTNSSCTHAKENSWIDILLLVNMMQDDDALTELLKVFIARSGQKRVDQFALSETKFRNRYLRPAKDLVSFLIKDENDKELAVEKTLLRLLFNLQMCDPVVVSALLNLIPTIKCNPSYTTVDIGGFFPKTEDFMALKFDEALLFDKALFSYCLIYTFGEWIIKEACCVQFSTFALHQTFSKALACCKEHKVQISADFEFIDRLEKDAIAALADAAANAADDHIASTNDAVYPAADAVVSTAAIVAVIPQPPPTVTTVINATTDSISTTAIPAIRYTIATADKATAAASFQSELSDYLQVAGSYAEKPCPPSFVNDNIIECDKAGFLTGVEERGLCNDVTINEMLRILEIHFSDCKVVPSTFVCLAERNKNEQTKKGKEPKLSTQFKNALDAKPTFIFIPVHLPTILHWTLVVIVLKETSKWKTGLYVLDSLRKRPRPDKEIEIIREQIAIYNASVGNKIICCDSITTLGDGFLTQTNSSNDCGVILVYFAFAIASGHCLDHPIFMIDGSAFNKEYRARVLHAVMLGDLASVLPLTSTMRGENPTQDYFITLKYLVVCGHRSFANTTIEKLYLSIPDCRFAKEDQALEGLTSRKQMRKEEAVAVLMKKKKEEEIVAELVKKKKKEEKVAAALVKKKKKEEEIAAKLEKKKKEEEEVAAAKLEKKKKEEEEVAAAELKKKKKKKKRREGRKRARKKPTRRRRRRIRRRRRRRRNQSRRRRRRKKPRRKKIKVE